MRLHPPIMGKAFIYWIFLYKRIMKKKKFKDKFGSIGLSTSLWAISKTNQKVRKPAAEMDEFIENGYLLDISKISAIEKQLLK